jgi:hypothetical protein
MAKRRTRERKRAGKQSARGRAPHALVPPAPAQPPRASSAPNVLGPAIRVPVGPSPGAPIVRRRRAVLARALALIGLAVVGAVLVRSPAPEPARARIDPAAVAGADGAAAPLRPDTTAPPVEGDPLSGVPADPGALRGRDRVLLREVFGIDDPSRLYASDSGGAGVLLYRAVPPGCRDRGRTIGALPAQGCRAVAVRVGLAAPRRAGETWDAFVGRVRRGGTRAFPAGAKAYYTGLASLDPSARPAFQRLVVDARRAGFRVSVAETYRSPERQALLLARGDGRTAAATSVHSYGRAADLIVGDGRIDRAATAREWVRFRRWVVRYAGGRFRLVGTPERTWDWPHVELARPTLGYTSLPALVDAARACRARATDAAAAASQCTITPNLPTHLQLHAQAYRVAGSEAARPADGERVGVSRGEAAREAR